ncbi:WD40 YVTN repeat-like-containing domain protein [Rutstroemia sp. NJR-2017a WRK4]|nr:WD40 YVTN repeat-like-containing domain protein [Rutstroemia sp. NJR-2017a WRK4]
MPDSRSDANVAPGLPSPSLSSARPRTTFLTLSRELRDKCYEMALTTSLPIVVWSEFRPRNASYTTDLTYIVSGVKIATEYRAATTDVRSTFPNLIRCNSTVASEAAMVFYRKNRFLFSGDWTWETVVEWLVKIGPTNRAFIAQIELLPGRLARAWESPDGNRCALSSNSQEPPFPRSRYLLRSPDSTAKGTVETINPAIEEFFQILNKNPRATGKLTITMSLHQYFRPGIKPISNLFWLAEWLFTMDLPNVMEKLSEQMTDVEILWSGIINKSKFDSEKAEIEKFWEVVTAEEEIIAGTEKWSDQEIIRATTGRKAFLNEGPLHETLARRKILDQEAR